MSRVYLMSLGLHKEIFLYQLWHWPDGWIGPPLTALGEVEEIDTGRGKFVWRDEISLRVMLMVAVVCRGAKAIDVAVWPGLVLQTSETVPALLSAAMITVAL